MDLDEIRTRLYSAAGLRMPRRDRDGTTGMNIEAIEDYLTETAIARAELEEARLHAHDALDRLKDEWDDVTDYEAFLDGKPSLAAVERAKAIARPDLRDGMRQARRLIDRLTDQIKRLEIDDRAASRRYTMLTGG